MKITITLNKEIDTLDLHYIIEKIEELRDNPLIKQHIIDSKITTQ